MEPSEVSKRAACLIVFSSLETIDSEVCCYKRKRVGLCRVGNFEASNSSQHTNERDSAIL